MPMYYKNSLETIMHYSELIANEKDYLQLEGLLCEFAKKLTGAERATVWFYDDKAYAIWSSTADGIEAEYIPIDRGLAGFSVKNELPVMCNNPKDDPRFYDAIQKKTGYELKNTIVVPIKNPTDETIGALQVLNKNGGKDDFTESDFRLVTYAVNFASTILKVIYLNYRINTIFEYASKIADETDSDKLLGLLANMGRDIIKADRATIWLYDEEKNILWTRVAHGVDRLEVSADSGIVGSVFAEEKAQIVNNPYEDTRFNKEMDEQTGYTTKSTIAIPLKTRDNRKIGVFQCVNKISKSEEFRQTDINQMKMIGVYIASTIELSRLYQDIEETQKEVISTMGHAGEFRSKETGNHVKRVAKYSYLLAKLYGIKEDEARILEMASPMHDIGKIAIPDDILNKPAKLTPEEFEIMKTHAQIGYEILASSKKTIMRAAAIVAGEHHEKWDGTGYPNGKKGEDIHIYGRISAIADVFDALGSDRCYKKAWELDKIIELFKNEQGKHFDPNLVDLFFANLPEFLKIRDELKD